MRFPMKIHRKSYARDIDEESNGTVGTVTDGTVRFFINFQMAAPLQIAKENHKHVIFQLCLLFCIYLLRAYNLLFHFGTKKNVRGNVNNVSSYDTDLPPGSVHLMHLRLAGTVFCPMAAGKRKSVAFQMSGSDCERCALTCSHSSTTRRVCVFLQLWVDTFNGTFLYLNNTAMSLNVCCTAWWL